MSKRTDEMIEKKYVAQSYGRAFFALRADAKRAVTAELAARRDELRRRLTAAHAEVDDLARELAEVDLDLRELNK